MSKHQKKHIGKNGAKVLSQYELAVIRKAKERRLAELALERLRLQKLAQDGTTSGTPLPYELDPEWEDMKNDIRKNGRATT